MFAYNKKFILTLGLLLSTIVLLGILSLAITLFESSPSPHEITTTNMIINRTRIFDYIREHESLPEYLSQLSQVDGKGDVTKDGWGAPITYLVGSNGAVTLESFGEYLHMGKVNGTNDLILSFLTRDRYGRWLNK